MLSVMSDPVSLSDTTRTLLMAWQISQQARERDNKTFKPFTQKYLARQHGWVNVSRIRQSQAEPGVANSKTNLRGNLHCPDQS